MLVLGFFDPIKGIVLAGGMFSAFYFMAWFSCNGFISFKLELDENTGTAGFT